MTDGSSALARAADDLAERIPAGLEPLARLAFNYWWSWAPGGPDIFRALDPGRFELVRGNPVRLLRDAPLPVLRRLEGDAGLVERGSALHGDLQAELQRPSSDLLPADRPIAFLCMEFGLHPSLPFYSGGLGVLAGDILKEASDRRIPMVGMGLMYWQGAFHQRLDGSGWQHDYWVHTDPASLPAALVTGGDGAPILITVPVAGREVTAQIWRVDVGRVPLYLLDTFRPENDAVDRWISARLYVGDSRIRLAQYVLLGVGAIRALRAMGIEPGVLHLNEGHPALAPLELAAGGVASGRSFDDALAEASARTVFTTHTPLAAGNETHAPRAVLDVLRGLVDRLDVDADRVLRLGRVDPANAEEGFGMTPLGLRVARWAGGVSRRHEEVARDMWRPLFDVDRAEDVPIGHVTNGVHVPTWMADPMRRLLDRWLGETWPERSDDQELWNKLDAVPDEELWAVRCGLRASLVEAVRERSALDRLGRGESSRSVAAARETFDRDVLTVGFARRVALYKRAYLLTADPGRAARLMRGRQPIQVVIAGKAHPEDEAAKQTLQALFRHRWGAEGALRVAFLEDYDMEVAAMLVAGCDVWLNVPRPPLEASGTSGMKAALNGALNVSVLDGWWAEAHDGTNGWAIPTEGDQDPRVQDSQDAEAMYNLMEGEVVPAFYERDEGGIPRAWVARIRASMRSLVPRFGAGRMLREYVEVYGGRRS